MSGFAARHLLLTGCALAVLSMSAAAQPAVSRPDFSATGWLNENTFHGGELLAVPGSPPLFHQDPDHPFVPNNAGRQPTYRIADLSNANVKQWAKDVMKKDNDEVVAGKTPSRRAPPASRPAFRASTSSASSLFSSCRRPRKSP